MRPCETVRSESRTLYRAKLINRGRALYRLVQKNRYITVK